MLALRRGLPHPLHGAHACHSSTRSSPCPSAATLLPYIKGYDPPSCRQPLCRRGRYKRHSWPSDGCHHRGGARRVTDNRNDPANVALIRITYQEGDGGESAEVTLDPVVFVGLVHAMRTLGREHARAVLQFGATLVKPALTAVDTQRLDYVLSAVERYIAQWEDPSELAMALSFEQRRDHQLTDTQAALFATALLDQPVSAEVWRQRVDRWAAAQQRRPPDGELQPRRPG